MSVSTIGMRSVSSCNASSSRLLLPRTSSSLYYTNNSSKKNEVWNTFSDSPTLISSDSTTNNNNKMLRRVGLRREGGRDEGGLHQLYNMNLVIPTSKQQKKKSMKQSTRRSYKRGFDKEVNVGKGGSSCTDVNGIEMGMGYFSSSLSTSTTASALSPADHPQERRGEKKRPRTEVEVVPQDELSTHEEEVPRDSSATSTETAVTPQDDNSATTKEVPQVAQIRSRPQEEEWSAIVVNVTTPTHKLNNNGLMNENAKYLTAKSQLYQAYLQALNHNQD